MKRLGLYMFHDARGEVRGYVPHKLRAMRPHLDRLVVVSNGPLTSEGRATLQQVAEVVHERPNEGFDVGAYREGVLEVVGLDALKACDELLLFNFTFYAPIFPFAELFSTMERRDADFWGLTAFKGPARVGEREIPFHLQSHFIAVRAPMLHAPEFGAYWQQLPPITSYRESIDLHEIAFTPHFQALGYRADVYSDPGRHQALNPAVEAPDELLRLRSPMLKRRPFFESPQQVVASRANLRRTLELVDRHSDYPLELVFDDLTRVTAPRTLYTNLQLLDVLPDVEPPPALQSARIAVLAHADRADDLSHLMAALRRFAVPAELHVTVTAASEVNAVAPLVEFAQLRTVTLASARHTPFRSPLLARLRTQGELFRDGRVDLALCLDARPLEGDPLVAPHRRDHMLDALVGTPAEVSQLLSRFEREPRLGMAFAPALHGSEPAAAFDATEREALAEVLDALQIRVPRDDAAPLSPRPDAYWVRPAVLHALLDADLDDVELARHLPVYACQQAGYYPRSVMTAASLSESHVRLEAQLLHERSLWPSLFDSAARLADRLESPPLRAAVKGSLDWLKRGRELTRRGRR